MREELILQQIGLSDKEALVYLAALQLGEATILELAKKAGLNRPHVYNVVKELSSLGLLSRGQRKTKIIYSVEDPKKLKDWVKRREDKINQLLPFLGALYNVPRGTKPKIKIAEGREETEKIFLEMIKCKKIDCLLDSGEIFYKQNKSIAQRLTNVCQRNKIQIRELVNKDPGEIKFLKKYCRNNYRIRVIPAEAKLTGNTFLYGKTIALLSGQYLILTIESEALTANYQALFELAWKASTTIKR